MQLLSIDKISPYHRVLSNDMMTAWYYAVPTHRKAKMHLVEVPIANIATTEFIRPEYRAEEQHNQIVANYRARYRRFIPETLRSQHVIRTCYRNFTARKWVSREDGTAPTPLAVSTNVCEDCWANRAANEEVRYRYNNTTEPRPVDLRMGYLEESLETWLSRISRMV